MRERPILFSAPMVRALLDGRKTQTRRVVRAAEGCTVGVYSQDGRGVVEVVNVEEDGDPADLPPIACPYGVPGDRLWVRETFSIKCGHEASEHAGCVLYYADEGERYKAVLNASPPKKPSIFMPRWASRITLEVTKVRVQRLKEITGEDALAEGVVEQNSEVDPGAFARVRFGFLWDSLNAKRGYSWESNPWVWAITFRRAR